MNIWNVIIKYDQQDNFNVNLPANQNILTIPLYNRTVVSTDLYELLQKRFSPNTNCRDLLNISIAVYTADQLIQRSKYGYQGWSRHLKFFVPVASVEVWLGIKKELEELLSFLSGDKWEIYFRNSTSQYPKIKNSKNENIKEVSLFSGGLDSFIGAIDLLERKQEIVLVSHHKKGPENKVQNSLYAALQKLYGVKSFQFINFYVQPTFNKSSEKEITSRARSFLFMCLGVSVANSIGETIKFIVPENGLISLNIPLTQTRIGSLSTRTTHPYYLSLFKKVIKHLGINNTVSNPYQFHTKGEMMLNCKNQSVLKSLYGETISCSHPAIGRYKGKSPSQHCGYCTPCIIRQAAEKLSGNKNTIYANNIKKQPPSPLNKSGRDLRAFKLAIERLKRKKGKGLVFELLKAGPIPFTTKSEIDNYCSVYKKGMDEVANFLA